MPDEDGDELHTAIVEIESIINSKPLSYVTSSDLEEPLTPSHLFVGRQVLNLPHNLGYSVSSDDEDFTIDSSQLDRRSKHLTNTLNHFWKRWRTEYLTELRKSHRQSTHDCSTKPPIKEGDVVIVHDESLPQGLWKLGRIQGVITGRDGKIRGATVKVASRSYYWPRWEDSRGHSEGSFKETSAAPATPADTAAITL